MSNDPQNPISNETGEYIGHDEVKAKVEELQKKTADIREKAEAVKTRVTGRRK